MTKAIYLSLFILLNGCASSMHATRSNSPVYETASAPAEAVNVPRVNCNNGEIRKGFITPFASGDSSCPEGVQTCINGDWVGPHLHDTCQNSTKSCQASPHGTVVHGYAHPTTTKGIPCAPATKTCMDGNWLGPEVFTTCQE